MGGLEMQKLFFMLFLVTAFGIFLFSCQNSMNPSESPEMSAIESRKQLLSPNVNQDNVPQHLDIGRIILKPGLYHQ
jgi:hypothetical protein